MTGELEVKLDNDSLIIKVGLNVLAFAFENSDYNNPFNDEINDWVQSCKVVDPIEFAKEIRRTMMSEDEDGSTPLSRFLDKMCEQSADYGNMGLEYPEDRK